MSRQGKYPQELHERAVRIVFEHRDELWGAIIQFVALSCGFVCRLVGGGCSRVDRPGSRGRSAEAILEWEALNLEPVGRASAFPGLGRLGLVGARSCSAHRPLSA